MYMSVYVCEIKLCLVFQCQGVDTLSTEYALFKLCRFGNIRRCGFIKETQSQCATKKYKE